MSRWFRFYDDAVNDPKVQRLAPELFKAWVNILCIVSKSGGILPETAEVAFTLRVKKAKAQSYISALTEAGLLDVRTDNSIAAHNWDARQFKSDVSNERVKRHRERKCNVTSPVTVTPPETEADTEQNRTEPDARSALQKRVGDFRQAIVSAYAEANSPSTPDTSRAELWVTQGYQEDICLAVIAGIVPRKPNVGLSYFDGPIAEAHTKKAPPRKTVGPPPPFDWDAVFTTYKKLGYWSRDAGNDPTSPACRAPPEFLKKYGFEVQAA